MWDQSSNKNRQVHQRVGKDDTARGLSRNFCVRPAKQDYII